MWGGTNIGAIPIVGTLAATLGLSFSISIGGWPVVLMGLSAGLVVASAATHFLADVIIASRKRVLEKKEVVKSSFAWVVIPMSVQFVFFTLTFASWAAAIGLAAANAVDDDGSLDERLAARIETYVDAVDEADTAAVSEAVSKIESFCAEHVQDDHATNVFREACSVFENDEPPNRGDSGKLVKRLRE